MRLPRSHGATEIRREGGTRRQGEWETRRMEDKERDKSNLPASTFPLLPFSLAPCLLVFLSLSPCLRVSVAYFSLGFIKRLHQRLSDSAKWRRNSSTFASQL